MPRIDSSSGTAVPIDTASETGPTPAPSRPKPASTPAPTARNEVRAYAGPPARGPSSAATPAGSGPTVSASELEVLRGRPRPASPDVPGSVYTRIREHLTTGLTDWRISGNDVKAVHTALGTLQPGAYRVALERMERDHLLGAYVKAQDPDARLAFLEQAESKGLLQRRKGDAPAGPLGYPAMPDFFRNDSRLPASMRDAVNQHAIQAGAGFYRGYAGYLDRYAQAVEAAKSPRDLEALGAPRKAHLKDSVLGLDDRKDPAREAYAAAWRQGIGQPESLNRTYQRLNARHRELTGERPAGSLQLNAKVEVSRGPLKGGVEAKVDTRGKVGLKGEAGVELKGGPLGLELMHDTSGKQKVETKLDLGFLKLSVASDGEAKLSLGPGKDHHGFVKLNLEKAEFGGGVTAKVKAPGGAKVEVETGVSMKGLTSEHARQAVDKDHRGLFDASRKKP
ncbi:hypothetical protein [Pyxidicoccus xibeiensis]|uniref:hypothetical protein n=1 Tax=Pyxidicoccus xibeiensis TaxID=2906759 RepID=UPI0020A6EB3B|nr:hypothetical protein [Pyxidicoccus xibeiensis]MCP3137255.1 hypothetical protein [Pyxidicoccus xibeiensis]